MATLLLLDDDRLLVDALERALRPLGIVLDGCSNATDFMRLAAGVTHDALLIEWCLHDTKHRAPGLCRALRRRGDERPIAIVSGSLDREQGARAAQDSGADMYIEKSSVPTLLSDIDELTKRLGERWRVAACHATTHGPALSINIDDSVVTISHLTLRLRSKEAALLRALLEQKGRVVSKSELARRAWGLHVLPATTVVETTLSRLRKALGPVASVIQTVPGGYLIAE